MINEHTLLHLCGVYRSLETERDQLAPHVAHWQKVQQMEAEFSTAKMKLLQDQQKHGSRLITYQQDQVGLDSIRDSMESETLRQQRRRA